MTTNGTNGNATPAAWTFDAATFNAAMKGIKASQDAADEAQNEADKAKAKVSELVIAYLEKHGRQPAMKDGKPDGEPTHPEVVSKLFGCKVQPAIRNSETKDGRKSRTGFLKRFGQDKDVLKA